MIDFKIIDVNEFYNLNNEQQKNYIENVKEAIKKSNNEIVKKMNNIVIKNVKYFRNDFYLHDICLMKEYPGRFIWMTRETGTDLIPIDFLDKYMISWFHAVKKANKNFYYYNGKTLKKINIEEADKIINEYQKN